MLLGKCSVALAYGLVMMSTLGVCVRFFFFFFFGGGGGGGGVMGIVERRVNKIAKL